MRKCGTCERPGEFAVYALPTIPYSEAVCEECFENGAVPRWLAERWLEASHMADHGMVYDDGEYIPIRAL